MPSPLLISCVTLGDLPLWCALWWLWGIFLVMAVGSVVAAHQPSCPIAYRILAPWPGIELMSLALEGRFSTTVPTREVLVFPAFALGFLQSQLISNAYNLRILTISSSLFLYLPQSHSHNNGDPPLSFSLCCENMPGFSQMLMSLTFLALPLKASKGGKWVLVSGSLDNPGKFGVRLLFTGNDHGF